MALSVKCTGVNFKGNGGIDLSFNEADTTEFPNLEILQMWAAQVDDPANTDLVRRMIVRWWLERDPNAENVDLILGRRLTFDMGTAEMIAVVDES